MFTNFPLIIPTERNWIMDITPFSPEWDRRNSRRESLGLPVIIPPGERKIMTRNLSQEGCFIPQVDLGPVGATVALNIDIPGFGLLPIQARIIHKGKGEEGTGIEFVSLTPEAVVRLGHFLSIFNS